MQAVGEFRAALRLGATGGAGEARKCRDNPIVAAIWRSTQVGRDNSRQGGFATTAVRVRDALSLHGPLANADQATLITALGIAITDTTYVKYFFETAPRSFFRNTSPAVLAALVRGIGEEAYTRAQEHLNAPREASARGRHVTLPSPQELARNAGISNLWDPNENFPAPDPSAVSPGDASSRKRRPDGLEPHPYQAKRHDSKVVAQQPDGMHLARDSKLQSPGGGDAEVRQAQRADSKHDAAASPEAGKTAATLLHKAGMKALASSDSARKLTADFSRWYIAGGHYEGLADRIKAANKLLDNATTARACLDEATVAHRLDKPADPRAWQLQEIALDEAQPKLASAIDGCRKLVSALEAANHSQAIEELAGSIESELGEPVAPDAQLHARPDLTMRAAWKLALAIENDLSSALVFAAEFEKIAERAQRPG